MTVFDWIANRFGYMKADGFPRFLQQTAAVQKFNMPSGDLWKSQADLYRRLSWVNTVVSAIANSCATTAFEVKKMVDEKTESIINHPFELLLQRPNPLMSRSELLVATISFLSLTGNSYWWQNKENEDAIPDELWIIPAHMIKPVPDEQMFIRGYAFEPGDGSTIHIPTWQIVHFKSFNPLNPYVGLSPIEAIAVIAIGDMKMQDWNTRLFAENNARLPGILAFAEQIAEPEWQKMIKDSRDKSARRELMMLRGVGKGGVEWIQAAVSQREMEFLAGRKFTKEEIFNIYAPGFASMTDVNATEANATAGKATYMDTAIWPLLVSVGEKLTNNVLPSFGPNLKGEFDDVRLTDRKMLLDEQAQFAKIHTIDEVRQKFYESEKLGDERGEMLVAQIGPSPVRMIDGEIQNPIPAPDFFTGGRESQETDEEESDQKAMKSELDKWQRKAERRLQRNGSAICYFESDILPIGLKAKVTSLLGEAKQPYDLQVIFDLVKADLIEYGPIVEALKDAAKALRENSK